jgi:predicted metal-dependent TIM-barrel fold hydrolase
MSEEFVSVIDISNFSPTQAVLNTEVEITSTVEPSNATNKEIFWWVVSYNNVLLKAHDPPLQGTDVATFRTTGTGAGKRTFITPKKIGAIGIQAIISHGSEA